MAEETTTPSSDVSETQASEENATETVKPQDESTETVEETPEETPSIKDLQAQVKRLEQALNKANKDAKDQRFKTQELTQQAKELAELKQRIESEKLSEQEKQELTRKTLEKQLADLQKERDDVLRQSQERTINYEVRLQAAQMGIVDPDAAARLLDWSEIEYDDSGAPTNVQELLNALIKAKPYLKATQSRQAPTSGGATNPPRSQTGAAKEISWDMIAKLTPAEYAARAQEIQQWMAKHSRR